MNSHIQLAEKIVTTASRTEDHEIMMPFRYKTNRQNQFVFFLKPEVFLVEDTTKQEQLVRLALEKFDEFAVSITGGVTLSGSFLERSAATDRHYGFINLMSRRASQQVQGKDAAALRAAVDAPVDAPILGGHEYTASSGLDAAELDRAWQKKQSVKIRSGLYAQCFDFGDGPIVLVNGFHPAQIAHFTEEDRRIVVMLLESDLPWSFIRARMIGDTFPERAASGSLRRILHDSADHYGLGSVDITNNCVHLSAGPFEAIFEMSNFLGKIPDAEYDPSTTVVAQLLADLDVPDHLTRVQDNPSNEFGSLFDLTEGVDARSGVALYASLFANRG